MDRRSHERLGVQLRCTIRLPGAGQETGDAVTENISRGGILLRWAMTANAGIPKIGDVIEADIPLRLTTRFGQRYLRCVGEVVRISREGEADLLVALRFRNMRVQMQALHKAAAVAAV